MYWSFWPLSYEGKAAATHRDVTWLVLVMLATYLLLTCGDNLQRFTHLQMHYKWVFIINKQQQFKQWQQFDTFKYNLLENKFLIDTISTEN